MSYEKRSLIFYSNYNVNRCPHCGIEFVVFAVWGQKTQEQVGPTIYCYMCGKRFNEEVCKEE